MEDDEIYELIMGIAGGGLTREAVEEWLLLLGGSTSGVADRYGVAAE